MCVLTALKHRCLYVQGMSSFLPLWLLTTLLLSSPSVSQLPAPRVLNYLVWPVLVMLDCYSSYLAFKTLFLCRFCSQLPQSSFSYPTCLSLLSLIFVWETASPRLAWLFYLSSLSVWDCKVHATTSVPYSENPFHSIIHQLLDSCPISLLTYKLQNEN